MPAISPCRAEFPLTPGERRGNKCSTLLSGIAKTVGKVALGLFLILACMPSANGCKFGSLSCAQETVAHYQNEIHHYHETQRQAAMQREITFAKMATAAAQWTPSDEDDHKARARETFLELEEQRIVRL